MFSGCPSVRPLTPILRDAISTKRRDLFETCHKYSSCEWALPKRVSRSEFKGQGHDQTN